MSDSLAGFFSGDFMPHGHCYYWRPEILWLNVLSDSAIALAYLSIPITMLYYLSRTRRLPFSWVVVLYAAFIVLCGTTHVMDIWVVWNPDYGVQGLIKLAAAIVSLGTAAAIVPLVPRLLALPTTGEMQDAITRLRAESEARGRAEADLEQTVEQLKSSNAELERFAYVASHDLQAPLRSIAGFAQLLQRRYSGRLDATADEYLGYVGSGVGRMAEMVDSLLRLARIDGKLDLDARTSAAAALAEAQQRLADSIRDSGARVQAAELPQVHASRELLVQLFQNLLSNAIKFQPVRPLNGPEHPRVDIDATRDGAFWHFNVRDNGTGLEESASKDLFQAFKRFHDAARYEGTGIGLALCKKIVERHGGRIWAESRPGAGTAIHFTLRAA